MKRRKDNNLVLLKIGEKKYYFTSMSKAGLFIGIAAASVKWAINYNTLMKSYDDEDITFSIVDGSDIPYKYINLER